MPPASGGTSLGLSSATPMNTRAAPRPTSATPAPPNSPAASAATPRIVSTAPPGVMKRAPLDVGSTAPSRSAATGGTRVARIAGARPLTSVTSVPTTSDTTIVRVSMTVPSDGRSAPKDLNSARRPGASTRPSSRPRIEPSRPTSRPSSSTDRITWPREAPSVRSSANSRIRCATVIEKVLKMMNAPTNSAMPPKISSAVVRKPERLVDVVDVLVGLLLAGADVDGHRRPDLAQLIAQLRVRHALLGRDDDLVERVGRARRAAAPRCSVVTTSTKPPTLDTPPKLARPDDLQRLLGAVAGDVDGVADLDALAVGGRLAAARPRRPAAARGRDV